MAILRVAIFIFAVVVPLFSLMANGELITRCIGTYAQACSDQESSEGVEKCCSLIVNLYKTDTDCLCSIYEYTDMNIEVANKKLSECGINTKDVPFSCNFNKGRILYGHGASSLSLNSPSLAPNSLLSIESPLSSLNSPSLAPNSLSTESPLSSLNSPPLAPNSPSTKSPPSFPNNQEAGETKSDGYKKPAIDGVISFAFLSLFGVVIAL